MDHRSPNRPPDDDDLADTADSLGPAVLAEAARRRDLGGVWTWDDDDGRVHGVHTHEGQLVWFADAASGHDTAAAVQGFGDFLRAGQGAGPVAPGPVISALHQAIRAIVATALDETAE